MSPQRMATASSMALVEELLQSIQTISTIGDEVRSHRKSCWNLARRIKLLAPLFEEIRDVKSALPPQAVVKFQELRNAFAKAKIIFEECRDGSRLHMILERDAIIGRFQAITGDLSHALDELPLNLLAVSDEIQEQAELVQAQLKRAKNVEDAQEELLHSDLQMMLNDRKDSATDTAMMDLLMKLGLNSLPAITKEVGSLEKARIANSNGCKPTSEIDQLSQLLNKLKISLGGDEAEPEVKENPNETVGSSSSSPSNSGAIPPDDFRCPISLELMRDPVIVSTGQTYDRQYIEQWIKAGHKTCPKTQQILPSLALIPNYSLRSLIQQWCEANGVELPKRNSRSSSRSGVQSSGIVEAADKSQILQLKERLKSDSDEILRNSAGELRLLAKKSTGNRVFMAEAGIIPLLVELLSGSDTKTQEHAVTALLNMSINDLNKSAIVSAGAIEPIVQLLKTGTMETRENAAATLFSLSVIDENKISIGQSGAIPPLVDLLREGRPEGKKDAATALFNLSIYQGNKTRAVRAGIITPLMDLLKNRGTGMVDESLAILAILASSPEGRNVIGQAKAVPVLIDLMSNGSGRNKENAASVLLSLCQNDNEHTVTALELNATAPLASLLRHGTPRAKRKASQLLQHLQEYELMEKS